VGLSSTPIIASDIIYWRPSVERGLRASFCKGACCVRVIGITIMRELLHVVRCGIGEYCDIVHFSNYFASSMCLQR
jgi:hypothetical protein